MRLPDNGDARKLGRLDRVEERSAARITEPTEKPPGVENNRRDRPLRGTERKEESIAHEDRGKVKGDKDDEEGRKSSHSVAPIRYRLSNSRFLELGWTRLPIAVTKRRIAQYEVTPAKPHLDRFKVYRNRATEYYSEGLTPFLRYHSDGSGELFYPNGALAVRCVRRPKGRNYDVYTVLTAGDGKDVSGTIGKSQILAMFDTAGNGVVLDGRGATRLSYNQTGGIFTDNPAAGPPLVWSWDVTPRRSILETVYTESSADRLQMKFFPEAEARSSDGKKKKVAEVQKPVVERRQEDARGKSSANRDSCVKIICMKLNEFLSLRIVDRRNIALRFVARGRSVRCDRFESYARIQLGTIVHFDRETAPRVMIEGRRDAARYRFQAKLSAESESESDSSSCDSAENSWEERREATRNRDRTDADLLAG